MLGELVIGLFIGRCGCQCQIKKAWPACLFVVWFRSIGVVMYFLWSASPFICRGVLFTLRWYNMLFALPFVIGFFLMAYMYRKEGKDVEHLHRLLTYVCLGTMFGARLGHVFFYNWSYFKHHLWEVIFPFVLYPKFRITGYEGLASHGAAVGIVLGIFFYTKRIGFKGSFPFFSLSDRQSSEGFLWILDRLVILVALGGCCIRIANFTNSEIVGKPTHGRYGVVFAYPVKDDLSSAYADYIDRLQIVRSQSLEQGACGGGYLPVQIRLVFKHDIQDEKWVRALLEDSIKKYLVALSYGHEPMIREAYGTPLKYVLCKDPISGSYQAVIDTLGVPRHPAQLYESFSCLCIFILLWIYYERKGRALVPGRIFGLFLTILFGLRFFHEFYKENQESFEDGMLLNMGQWLSLPWVIFGIYLLWRKAVSRRRGEDLV